MRVGHPFLPRGPGSRHLRPCTPRSTSPERAYPVLAAMTQPPCSAEASAQQPSGSWSRPRLCPISWATVAAAPVGSAEWSCGVKEGLMPPAPSSLRLRGHSSPGSRAALPPGSPCSRLRRSGRRTCPRRAPGRWWSPGRRGPCGRAGGRGPSDQRRGQESGVGGARMTDGRGQDDTWVESLGWAGPGRRAERGVTRGGAGEGPKGRSGRVQEDRWAGSG